jgi:hypothetical protein
MTYTLRSTPSVPCPRCHDTGGWVSRDPDADCEWIWCESCPRRFKRVRRFICAA